MNDTELDELLDTWSAPTPPPRLRTAVRAGYLRTQMGTRRSAMFVPWKAVFVGGAVAVAGILLVTSAALPQTPGVPYTVESEFVTYANGAKPTLVMNEISYSFKGSEQMLSRWLPDEFQTALARTVDLAGTVMSHFHHAVASHLGIDNGTLLPDARVIAGCANPSCHMIETYPIGSPADLQSTGCVADNKLVGEATVLGYRTMIVQRALRSSGDRRATLWLAPRLSCFALKIVTEEKSVGGDYRPISERRAIKVSLNP